MTLKQTLKLCCDFITSKPTKELLKLLSEYVSERYPYIVENNYLAVQKNKSDIIVLYTEHPYDTNALFYGIYISVFYNIETKTFEAFVEDQIYTNDQNFDENPFADNIIEIQEDIETFLKSLTYV